MRPSCRLFACSLACLAWMRAVAVETLSESGVFGFTTDFLSYRNATSKGWNFGNTAGNAPTVTLLGVTLTGNLGANDGSTGINFPVAPLTYAIAGFGWTGAPEQAARDNLSKGGLHGGSGSFALKLSAAVGRVYVVDILALDNTGATGRNFDVRVDGVLARDNWFIPDGSPFNRVLRLRTVADADGIDIAFERGSLAGDGNPAISALALTEDLSGAPAIASFGPSQTQPVGGLARFDVSALGTPPLSYAWRKDGVVITNTTSSVLNLQPLTAFSAGEYDVVVTNTLGAVTGSVAVLHVITPYAPGSGGILQDLAGYWRFDESQGQTVADWSGQHNSANLVNFSSTSNAQWGTGKVGGALVFGGTATAQYAAAPDFPKASAAYTVSAWVWADSRPTWASVAKNWFGEFHFGLDGSNGQLSNYLGLTGGLAPFARENGVFPLGSWQHVACTVGGGSMRIYRNAILVGTNAYSAAFHPTPPQALAIGAKLTGSVADSYWHGRIDELALWNRALPHAEVYSVFRAGQDGLDLAQATAQPPQILSQSTPQTQPIGGRAMFSVSAAGGGPSYQWRRDGQPVTRVPATSPTLVLDPLEAGDAGDYDVVVSDANGSVTGAVMTLHLAVPLPAAATGILRDLAGYWRFDETQGLTAADTSGRHNTASLVNFPVGHTQWGAGRVGGALRFGGTATAHYATAPNFPKTTNNTYSISAWVWAESRPTWASIAKNWLGEFHFGLDNTNGQLSNYIGLTGGINPFARDPDVFPVGAWQHVACAADGAQMRVYRNGLEVATVATPASLLASPPQALAIAAKLSGTVPDSYWHGWIDDLALWNRALSGSEVQLLHAAGATGGDITHAIPPPPPAALVINEFLSDNAGGLEDDDRDTSDWIELYNGTASPVNLDGYSLTDNALNPTKWRFPAVTLAPDAYLLVWASGEDRRVPGQPLHANFQLASSGEDLLLIAPDGTTVVHGYTSPFQPVASPVQPWYPTDTNVSLGLTGAGTEVSRFVVPSPGGPNLVGGSPRGAVIDSSLSLPANPPAGTNLVVSARILADLAYVATNTVLSATLHARVMYGAEQSLVLHDDGLDGDLAAGDGIWSATLPNALGATAGQMVRWRFTATTAEGRVTRAPAALLSDAPVYEGSVIADPAIGTPLPVFHRFVETPALAETLAGTRCAVFHNGQFFDNATTRIRGNTSLGWPKKSYKVELPLGRTLDLGPGRPAVDEFDLNTTYTDKSYARAPLVSEMYTLAGLPTPEIFPVHVRQNAAFYSVAHYVEQPDSAFLSRHGMDPDGSFYKAVGDTGACRLDDAATLEKKTRFDEGNADLVALVAALNLTGPALEAWLFDNLDLPAVVNFMAGVAITQNIDASNKNYFLHRDSDGSREWMFIPWDLDLAFGPNALNTDTIVATENNPALPKCTSHPYLGARPWLLEATKFNRLQEEMAKNPRTRAMLNRRIRSLSDRFLATGWFATRLDQWKPLLQADVDADHLRWGASSHFNWTGGGIYTLAQAMDRIQNEYLTPRLAYLTVTHAAPATLDFVTGLGSAGIPATQTATPILEFGAHDANPAGGNQDQEFVELVNPGPDAVDLSDWTLTGGITFTFKGGTVLPAGESLFVTPDRFAFRQRVSGPRGAEGRLVVGDADGHLSNLGEILELRTASSNLVATLVTPAAPSDAQRWLRITEIDYHPPGDGLAEFIELHNTSTNTVLDLEGVHFSAGVEFTFGPGASLASGAFALVVRDASAFALLHGGGLPVTGVFQNASSLANGGERVALDDATGSTIQELTYGDSAPWPPAADGLGSSLHFVLGSSGPPESPRWFARAPDPALAPADSDGDGAPNLDEFVAGTLPGDPASILRLLPAASTNAQVRLEFPVAAGKSCAVQGAPTPTGPWTVLHTEPAGAARTGVLVVPAGEGRGYYRLITPAP